MARSSGRGGGGAGRLSRARRLAGPLAGLAAAVLLVSGCGTEQTPGAKGVASVAGSPGSAAAGPGGAGNPIEYSKCMRENGVPKFPDPNANGNVDINGNEVDTNGQAFKDAQAACQSLLPAGGGPNQAPPEEVKAATLEYSKCMRENGVPKFPDPNPQGGLDIDAATLGVDPMGDVFRNADDKCKKILEDAAGGPRVDSPIAPVGGPGAPLPPPPG